MAWLIRERATLKGEMDRRKKELEQLPRTICELEADLASLDKVIPRHEVKVDPSAIKGIRPHGRALFGYGKLGKAILECLRLADGTPLYTSEIAMHVARKLDYEMETREQRNALMTAVGYRLKNLTHSIVTRCPQPGRATGMETQWFLAADDADQDDRLAA